MTPAKIAAAFALLLALLPVTTGCGAPTGGDVRVIDPKHVPYNLLSPAVPSAVGSTSEQAEGGPRLYWTDANDHLARRPPAAYCVTSVAAVVTQVLSQLNAGPTQSEQAAGLGTAMPPEPWVQLVSVHGRTARLRIIASDTLDPSRVTLAAGQVVLSVTSVDGIDRVAIEHDDRALHIPLPDGDLATGAVTADDYAPLLADAGDRAPAPALPHAELLCPERGQE